MVRLLRETKLNEFGKMRLHTLTGCLFTLRVCLGSQGTISFSRKVGKRMLSIAQHRVMNDDEMRACLARIDENNLISEADLSTKSKYVPFVVDSKVYGYCQPSFTEKLASFPDVLSVTGNVIEFNTGIAPTEPARTEAMSHVTQSLREAGVITGWRDELLPVVESFGADPVFLVERAAYPWFGTRGYGIHVNGFVVSSDNSSNALPKLWVARRSPTKQTWPGMLDNICAGGLPHGISPSTNVVKECGEEASIPQNLARKAISTGAVGYTSLDEQGNLKRDVLFCFDLELPFDFRPTPDDGEVDFFQLQSIDWCLERVIEGGSEGYKPNCNLVVLDFMVRRGYITCDSHSRFLELVQRLRPPGMA